MEQTATPEQKLQTAFADTPEEKLLEFETKYSTFKIVDEFDKEGYAAAGTARKQLVKVRTGIDKIRKDLNADANAWVKQVNEKAKLLTARVEAVETHLETEISRIDNIQEVRRKEAEEKERIRIDSRKKQLFDAGMNFNGEMYIFETTTLTPEQLAGFDDTQIEAI